MRSGKTSARFSLYPVMVFFPFFPASSFEEEAIPFFLSLGKATDHFKKASISAQLLESADQTLIVLYGSSKTTCTTLFQGIRKLIGNGIPTPLGKPDERKMRKAKVPKRFFLISIARQNEEATKNQVFDLISKTFRCSRVAVSAVPPGRKKRGTLYLLFCFG